MRKIITFCLILAIGTFLIGYSPVWACSVSHVNTAEEITQKAEVIIRVKAVKYTKKNQYGGKIKFKILETIKGEIKQDTITLDGQTEKYDGPNDNKPPYNFVRPGGRHGNCFAFDYKMNGEYLLFLIDNNPYWSPLAATNEEVFGRHDPWIQWVKDYLTSINKVKEKEE